MRKFDELDEREILALAISSEEEDGRIYADFSDRLKESYPATARIYSQMAAEEGEHRRQLIETYRGRFGEHIPLVRRQDVRGFVQRTPLWLSATLSLAAVRRLAAQMEEETRAFYVQAANRTTDASTRRLLGDLAQTEAEHQSRAECLVEESLPADVREAEDRTARRNLVLRYVQPGLVGLMDGSVSTLAPVFAAAFATQSTWPAFLIGLAAALGAGISMGFAEALSDDGSMTGRGNPLLRGGVCGGTTTLGGLLHTLPFLIPSFWWAVALAGLAAAAELAAITWIRWRFMQASPVSAMLQVALGGGLVFAAGIIIGKS